MPIVIFLVGIAAGAAATLPVSWPRRVTALFPEVFMSLLFVGVDVIPKKSEPSSRLCLSRLQS
jgi:hypothetical protein